MTQIHVTATSVVIEQLEDHRTRRRGVLLRGLRGARPTSRGGLSTSASWVYERSVLRRVEIVEREFLQLTQRFGITLEAARQTFWTGCG